MNRYARLASLAVALLPVAMTGQHASAQPGWVHAHQKISATEGGFTGVLDDVDDFGFAVGGLGDLDGDGVIDIAVGAFGDEDGDGPFRHSSLRIADDRRLGVALRVGGQDRASNREDRGCPSPEEEPCVHRRLTIRVP